MSEPRCRAFLALLPNIRHNNLKALARNLSPRVKRLQGLPPPDPAKEAREEAARERARLGPAGLAAAARARARARDLRAAQDKQERERERGGDSAGLRVGSGATAKEMKDEEMEKEKKEKRRRALENGWMEGDFFSELDLDVLVGCSTATLQRCLLWNMSNVIVGVRRTVGYLALAKWYGCIQYSTK